MCYRPEGLLRPHLKPWYYEDGVLRVSPEGEVLAEISVLKALAATYPGLLSVNYEDHLEVDADDPLHLNGVEPLPAAGRTASRASPPGICWCRSEASTRSR